MAAEFNRVIILGNLTRDPELRYLDSGQALARFGIASSHSYGDSQGGERKEDICFVDVTVFGRLAETVHQYLKKGRQVLVEGRLTFRQWETDAGEKRSAHGITAQSVQFLGAPAGQGGYESQEPMARPAAPRANDSDDDIPF